jgi:hypothetical protein
MPPLDLSLLISPAHWLDGSPGSPSAWYWLLVVLFATLAVAGGISYSYLRPTRFRAHALHARLAEIAGMTAASLGLLGLFLLLMRFLNAPLLSARLLLYLTLLATLGSGGYGVYWYIRVYPGRLAAYRKEEERKRFLPQPKAARARAQGPATPAPKKRSKRK